MSFRALLYTAAAIAFFIAMIMRPSVDVPGMTAVSDQTATDQSSTDQSSVTINATQDADSQNGDAAQANNNSTQDQAADTSTQGQTAETSSTGQTAGDSTSTQEQTQTSGDAAAGEQTTSAAVTAAATAAATTAAVTTAAVTAADSDSSDSSASQTTAATTKPNYVRERRLGNEIRGNIVDGEILFLHGGGRNFMSIQTDADEARGGAIILHGRGFHPDWADTIHPLRTGLAEEGWTTLSLQMPVLDKDAKYYDYVPLFPEAGERIKAGIQHLKDQGISPIVLVAHSCGGHMAMHWVEENGGNDIDAFVGLGMGATDYNQQMAKPFPLDKIQAPVFDVYGEEEFPAVIKMAPERWELIKKAGNPQSEQRVLPGADHYFKDKGDEVTGLITTWLNGLKFE